jgi:geranylgeranylglycerol-phosphate geranylgeranyltransferase
MVKIASYIKIMRPKNAALTAIAVALGYWIADSHYPLRSLLLLMLAGICCVGFGNSINDICDAQADKINHPDRPIPKGDIHPRAALIWALVLAAAALSAGTSVSLYHGAGCLAPLIALTLYALFFKATPLFGNAVVSMLVAYAILYGGFGATLYYHLLIPAFCAFLLNLCREIVKDLQDMAGDHTYGLKTTAIVPRRILDTFVFWLGIVYALNVLLPFLFGHFNMVYLALCVVVLFPLHIYWLVILVKKRVAGSLSRISTLIKLEMLGGLIAMAADRIYYSYIAA